MFTGLIKEIGTIIEVKENQEGRKISIKALQLIDQIGIDDSVSVNGACQTAVEVSADKFTVQAIHTTLEKTNLGELKVGDFVNLELAMRLSDRLGGHLVQGHVNDTTSLEKIEQNGENYLLTFKLKDSFEKYIIAEGSITINGISLTVAYLDNQHQHFTVSIIPHTWQNTTLKYVNLGGLVNVEVDMLAKYVENLLRHRVNNA